MKLFYIPLNNTVSSYIKRHSRSTSLILLYDHTSLTSHSRHSHHPLNPSYIQSVHSKIIQKSIQLQSDAIQWLETCNPHHQSNTTHNNHSASTRTTTIRIWVKSSIYSIYTYLLNNIHSNEQIFKSIRNEYKQQSHIHIYYPHTSTTPHELKLQLISYSQSCFRYNLFYTMMSVLCLPLTLSMTILPGPNIFAAYNVYRIYCYYTCCIGALNLYNMLTIDYSSDNNNTELESDHQMKLRGRNVSYIDSDELDRITREWYEHCDLLNNTNTTNHATLNQSNRYTAYQYNQSTDNNSCNNGDDDECKIDLESQQLMQSNRAITQHNWDFDSYGFTGDQLESLSKLIKSSVPELQQYLYRWRFR